MDGELVRGANRIVRVAAWSGAGLIVMLLAALAFATRAPHRARHGAPAFTGAYLTGGAPQRDPELERVLADELPKVVAATDAERHGEDRARVSHSAELRASPAIAARGRPLVDAWQGMLDALDRYAGAPLHWKGYKDAEAELRARTHEVTDELGVLGLAYYLDAAVYVESGQAHAAIFAYRVEEVTFLRAAGERHRILSLRRIDHLDLARALLGMHSEELGDPVVLLDQIDELFATHVEPLRESQLYPLGDEVWRESVDGGRLSAAASGAIAQELARVADPRAALVASVRRHEMRHALDAQREKPLRYPAQLAHYLGRNADDLFVQHARAELAAYLSQIANEPAMPQLALWNVASLAEHRGTPEAYVGRVILAGLERITSADLATLSDAALRDAARALWAELYGESFPPMLSFPP